MIQIPKSVSTSFTAELSPEAISLIKEMFGDLPSHCPACGFTHPSDLWRRVETSWECMNCGDDIEWPSLVG